MNKIYTLEDNFDFEEIELEHPNSLQGGSYFTRMSIFSSPVYIQTSPCSTKSGIVKTTKKSYCDLMFNSHDDKAIQWFEQLEQRCIDAIFQKKDLWFYNEMELDDIETAFTSPIRLYKSGKNYLIRCNIANTSLSSGTFKCYDEHTNPVSLDKLENSSVKIIPLLEVQGIRFTSKNFTLELALKQVMIIENPDFMNECFIQPGNIKSIRPKQEQLGDTQESQALQKHQTTQESPELEELEKPITSQELEKPITSQELEEPEESQEVEVSENPTASQELEESENPTASQELEESENPTASQELEESENPTASQELEELEQSRESQEVDKVETSGESGEQLGNEQLSVEETQPVHQVDPDTHNDENLQKTHESNNLVDSDVYLGNSSPTLLDEVKLDYNNLGNEQVTLKSPEEVYYDLWYEARTRAKLAREEAIKAYLEAKNIKNLYMLDNFSDSDDELEEYLEE